MSEEKPQAKSEEEPLPKQPSCLVEGALQTTVRPSSKLSLDDLMRETPANNRDTHWEQMQSVGLEF